MPGDRERSQRSEFRDSVRIGLRRYGSDPQFMTVLPQKISTIQVRYVAGRGERPGRVLCKSLVERITLSSLRGSESWMIVICTGLVEIWNAS